MNIFQSPCRANTNKPVEATLKTIQLANAIIAGLKSAAATAVCVACRALWIKKAIIAKYDTIIASTKPETEGSQSAGGNAQRNNFGRFEQARPPELVYSPRIICDRAGSR